MKNSKSKVLSIIVSCVLLVILILSSIYTQNVSNEYDNLNIDKEKLNIFYLNVGQADSTLITANGYTMLIDGGNGSDGYYITQFLEAQGIHKIDYLIGTHIDEDHIGGFYKIVEKLDIGTIYMPKSTISKQFYLELQETIRSKKLEISTIETSQNQYSLGNATWKVLHVDNSKETEEQTNDTSIVIELLYGNTKYLFMGDASSKVEKVGVWEQVDVLKVAHHGSKTSTSFNFLEQVKPNYAVISAGNSDFPSKEVLERLKESNIKEENTYITKRDGTIWLTSDGNKIHIQTIQYNIDGANRKVSLMESKRALYFLGTK